MPSISRTVTTSNGQRVTGRVSERSNGFASAYRHVGDTKWTRVFNQYDYDPMHRANHEKAMEHLLAWLRMSP